MYSSSLTPLDEKEFDAKCQEMSQFLEAKQPDSARDLIDKILKAGPHSPENAKKIATMIDQIIQGYKQKRNKEDLEKILELQLIKKIFDIFSNDPNALQKESMKRQLGRVCFMLGQQQAKMGKIEDALNGFLTVIYADNCLFENDEASSDNKQPADINKKWYKFSLEERQCMFQFFKDHLAKEDQIAARKTEAIARFEKLAGNYKEIVKCFYQRAELYRANGEHKKALIDINIASWINNLRVESDDYDGHELMKIHFKYIKIARDITIDMYDPVLPFVIQDKLMSDYRAVRKVNSRIYYSSDNELIKGFSTTILEKCNQILKSLKDQTFQEAERDIAITFINTALNKLPKMTAGIESESTFSDLAIRLSNLSKPAESPKKPIATFPQQPKRKKIKPPTKVTFPEENPAIKGAWLNEIQQQLQAKQKNQEERRLEDRQKTSHKRKEKRKGKSRRQAVEQAAELAEQKLMAAAEVEDRAELAKQQRRRELDQQEEEIRQQNRMAFEKRRAFFQKQDEMIRTQQVIKKNARNDVEKELKTDPATLVVEKSKLEQQLAAAIEKEAKEKLAIKQIVVETISSQSKKQPCSDLKDIPVVLTLQDQVEPHEKILLLALQEAGKEEDAPALMCGSTVWTRLNKYLNKQYPDRKAPEPEPHDTDFVTWLSSNQPILTALKSFNVQPPTKNQALLEIKTFVSDKQSPLLKKASLQISRSNHPTCLDDIKARDFTVSALMLDLNGKFLDGTGRGLQDLKDLRLVTIGPSAKAFAKDPSQALRGAYLRKRLLRNADDELMANMELGADTIPEMKEIYRIHSWMKEHFSTLWVTGEEAVKNFEFLQENIINPKTGKGWNFLQKLFRPADASKPSESWKIEKETQWICDELRDGVATIHEIYMLFFVAIADKYPNNPNVEKNNVFENCLLLKRVYQENFYDFKPTHFFNLYENYRRRWIDWTAKQNFGKPASKSLSEHKVTNNVGPTLGATHPAVTPQTYVPWQLPLFSGFSTMGYATNSTGPVLQRLKTQNR